MLKDRCFYMGLKSIQDEVGGICTAQRPFSKMLTCWLQLEMVSLIGDSLSLDINLYVTASSHAMENLHLYHIVHA